MRHILRNSSVALLFQSAGALLPPALVYQGRLNGYVVFKGLNKINE